LQHPTPWNFVAPDTHHDHPDQHDHHDHDHGDHAGHSHAPASFGRAFAVGTALNSAFVAAQVFYGLAAHSVALLADAVHNLGDVLGLLLAWAAATLAQRRPTLLRTYGWGRSTILASLTNAVILLLSCGGIAVEAIRRFSDPHPVGGSTIIWVAVVGIAINGATALMFMHGRKSDLNVKGAFLHMASDAVVSAGVVIAGIVIQITGWLWVDPATSLVIVTVITIGTWSLLRDSVNLAMDTVPDGIDPQKIEIAFKALPGVIEIHDLHIWGLSTTDTALTAHLVHDDSTRDSNLIQHACEHLREHFGITHATLQLETELSAASCGLRSKDVV
jgi:cobalt-zinc-cadmium efflux system protein